LVRENPKRVEHRVQLGHGQWQLGLLLSAANRSEEAEAVLGEALQVFEQAARDFPADRFLLQEQAFSHRHLGNIANASGRVDESERHYRASIDLYVALQIAAPANVLYSREAAYTTWMLGLILDRAGRADAAASEYDKAIALYRRAVVDFPAEAGLKETLAEVLRQRGNLAK
jgi:tetratricopeptide (TPR) repeat protein